MEGKPGVAWEFGYLETGPGAPCWTAQWAPYLSWVPVGAYSSLANAQIGLSSAGDICDDLIDIHTQNSYFHWSCDSCLMFCTYLPGQTPPACPRGCGAVKWWKDASDEMWCLSPNSRKPWSGVFAQESGLVDVYDPLLADRSGSENDPTGPAFDICSGNVTGTPCSITYHGLTDTLGAMAAVGEINRRVVGNLEFKWYMDFGYAGPCMPAGFTKWPHANIQITALDPLRNNYPKANMLRNFHVTVVIIDGKKCLCIWESKTGRVWRNCNDPTLWAPQLVSVMDDALEQIWGSGNALVKAVVIAVILEQVLDWIIAPDPFPGPIPLVAESHRPDNSRMPLESRIPLRYACLEENCV